ncbi:transient receptor potential cation channel subfamily a member 1-like [Gigaspora margarita]|uniref:Transient receptor potential cation channel subfamily a member 1-like n=1 Tax=Gigaspora margarita TaxID=4874 RepID=A0A8H4ERI1_GIGMA|nr:transient receptor potential cation channel subfamily a member 1-like [Gigaspora margarita]
MTSNSDNSHVISIKDKDDQHGDKKILEIKCSPHFEYVAALEHGNISLWSVNNQKEPPTNVKTIQIDNIHTKGKDERVFAISDNKHVSFSHTRVDPYNFKILDFESGKEVSLNFPDWQKEIDLLSFIDNGDIVMVNAKHYRAYVFSNKDNITWVCKSMIELKYFKKIYITPKGKLIIFNDTIYEITMWDIEELSIKTRILIDWNHILESVEISDDEKLLSVCAKNEETKETRLYVFSTETGMNMAFFTTKLVINRFHLIFSRKGERLLFISGKQCYLMDPYYLRNPIEASALFGKIETQKPYIIRSDKIIYTIDGNVSIKELADDNWVKFLRKTLKDTNSITTPTKETVDIITEIITNRSTSDYNVDRKEFEGKYLKWGLELGDKSDKSVLISVIDFNYRTDKWNPDKKKQLDILPSLKGIDENNFILQCEVLENDDFVTITRIGVIIWTYKLSNIRMHYYWNDWNGRLEDFNFEKTKFKDLLENLTSGRILPVSNYETILKNLNINFWQKEKKEKKQLFKEFLENSIEEEFYLACYGKALMKTFIKLKDDKWIRSLGHNCIDRCMQENNHVISKISLLSIIFENFKELSENHPAFIASALSLIGFVVPSPTINPKSSSLHLSSYGKSYHLYKTSFFDILSSIFWNRWISFQKSFQNRFQNFQDNHLLFRDLIIKPVIDFYDVSHSSTILAIPLPNFVSYPKDYNFWKELLLPSSNPFTYSNKLEVINEEFYRYLNGEALLKFKWNTFGRKYYLATWAIYTVFLLSFVIAATCSKNISQSSLFILLNITIYLGIWHLLLELRQFIYAPLNYIYSLWNYSDLGAFLLPMISSFIWLQNNAMPTELATFSTLLLEIKFFLFFRTIELFGAYFSMIFRVAQRVLSFWVILGFIVFAFAHSLHLLLRPATNVSLDYPNYSNDPNNPWNLATTYNTIDSNGTIEENSSLLESPTATTNMFTLMGSAILAVYLLLAGNTASISHWDLYNNPALLILTTIFFFVAIIYLVNLSIGLLSNEISATKTRESSLILKAEILEEIESLYMLPHQRRKENWFPFIVFYECHTIKLREHVIYTQKDKWTGYKKPYISNNLNEVLLLPEEQPSFKQIEGTIKDLPTIRQIEKAIEDPILKELEDLKKLIEELKNK